MGLFDWVKEFKEHYKDHHVDYEITSDGTRITIEIMLRDIPEERVRNIVVKLDNAISTMSKGKLPLSAPSIKAKVEKIKEKIRPKPKRNNPLVTGVID